MKKLCVVLLMMSGLVFADQCSEGAQKVVKKLQEHNRTSVTLNYSADQVTKANACKAAIAKLNPGITVTMKMVSGSNKFKFSK